MGALLIGYARVSTDGQDLTTQQNGLAALGVAPDRIYLDHGLTGTNRERPGLREALAACREGDTLVVTKLDRLARSLPDARTIADERRTPSAGRVGRRGCADRTRPAGRIAEGVAVLQTALGRDRLGESPSTGRYRCPARRRPARRGDRLGADRRLVRRAAPAHREPGRAAQPSHRDRRGRWPRGLGHGGPWPASPHRRLGVPPREGGRNADRGTVVCRCRPVRPQPRRTSPPHPAGSADQSSAAWVCLLVNPSHKANGYRRTDLPCGDGSCSSRRGSACGPGPGSTERAQEVASSPLMEATSSGRRPCNSMIFNGFQ